MRLGLGLGLGIMPGGGVAPDPILSLFTEGEEGFWYDPSDLTTLFQDEAGATPVTTAGQSTARANDKSGNALTLTQATVANRPTYQTGGFLRGDGGDLLASAAMAAFPVFSLFIGLRGLTTDTTNRELIGQYTATDPNRAWRLQKTSGAKTLFFSYSTNGLAAGLVNMTASGVVDDAVVSVIANGTTIRFYVNGTLIDTDTAAITAGATAPLRLLNNQASNAGLVGDVTQAVLVARAVSEAERAAVEAALTALTLP